ncbi:MAG TPA: transposase [Cyclobacteriaceae bacterium]|nr:transposase [Cyclobacteriaceae bacterium]
MLYHVYNRGNNRQELFYERDHYFLFLLKIRKILLEFCELLSYCLMPNHNHLMIYAKEFMPDRAFKNPFKGNVQYHPLVRKIGTLQSSYTRALNNEMKNSGSLFQQKAKAKLLNEDPWYPKTCFHYSHQNPVKAELVKKMWQWEFSSFNDYAGYRDDNLVNKELAFELLDIPRDPAEFLAESEMFELKGFSRIF